MDDSKQSAKDAKEQLKPTSDEHPSSSSQEDAQSVTDICRDIRKIFEPKFKGTAPGFVLWKRLFIATVKGVAPGLGRYLESPSLSSAKVAKGRGGALKSKIEKHLCIMQTLRAVLLRLIPSHLATQLLVLPGWTSAEALLNITFERVDDKVSSLQVVELDSEAHVATMFKSLCALRRQHWPSVKRSGTSWRR
jgi:hypothetical protein